MSQRNKSANVTLIPDAFDDLPAAERQAIELNAAALTKATTGIQLPSGACNCPRCECLVPGEFVTRRMIGNRASDPTQAAVTAFCEHCDLLWDFHCTLAAGVWRLSTEPAINKSEFAKLCHFNRVRARLDKHSGVFSKHLAKAC